MCAEFYFALYPDPDLQILLLFAEFHCHIISFVGFHLELFSFIATLSYNATTIQTQTAIHL